MYDSDQISCRFVPRNVVERIFEFSEEDNGQWSNSVLHSCLRMQFFKEDSQDMYDFDKLALFCILYSGEDYNKKATLLFELMIGPENVIQQRGSKVKHIFSYLTVIACVITAEFIHSVSLAFCSLFAFFAFCQDSSDHDLNVGPQRRIPITRRRE